MREAILALVLGTLLITVGVIAVVGFRSSREALLELNTQHYLLAIAEVRNQTSRILESILLVAGEFQAMLRQHLIPYENTQELGLIFAERLRQEDDVDEVCYTGMPVGDYVSANRTLPGEVILRHALPGVEERQTSAIISSTGKLTVFDDGPWKKTYDPRTRSWFQDILKGNGKLVWTVFQAFGRSFYCLGAGVAIIGEEGHPKGVFMVDTSAEKLQERLSHLLPNHDRLLFVFIHENWLLAQDSTISGISSDSLRESALQAVQKAQSEAQSVASEKAFQVTSMTFRGRPFEVACADINIEGGLQCRVGLVIPEEQFLKLAKANLRSTILFGICALFLTAGISTWVSNRLASPLTQLSAILERVAAFDIPGTPSPRSCVREMAVVSDALDRLKGALRSFGRYVPVDVVRELIHTNRDASRGGQEYFITILFSELEMIRSNENIPESLRLLQEYFTIAAKVIEVEGAIDKFFGGGGVMALFNEPRPLLCHADVACMAALQWRDEWKHALRDRITSNHHEIRFGINTGTALIGNIGTKDRFAYTAMGDTVNLAHRLLELAFSFDLCILVGKGTHSEVSIPFEWRFLGSHQISGRTNQISVWELLGTRESLSSDLLQARDQFEQGLAEKNRGNHMAAQVRFQRALELRPSDRLSLVYLKEAESLI